MSSRFDDGATAVFSCFDGGVDGMTLGVWCGDARLPRLDAAVFSCFDRGVEGMTLRGLVRLCPLIPS